MGKVNVKSSVQKASSIPLNVCYNVNKMPLEFIMEAFLKCDFSSGLTKDTFHCHDLQKAGPFQQPSSYSNLVNNENSQFRSAK